MTQPNILLVLVDQMRRDELNPSSMPFLSQLARTGVSFPNAYCAAPLCQPSRTCIVTGKYPTRTGVCGNMNAPVGQTERDDTYAQHLRHAGYATAYIGKHHYIDRYNVGMDLVADDEEFRAFGYEHVWHVSDILEGRHNQDRYTHHWGDGERLEAYRQNLTREGYEALDPAETVDGYILQQSREWLEAYKEDRPFFLTVGIVGPHPPYWVPPPYCDLFAPEDMAAPVGVDSPSMVLRFRRQRARKWGMLRLIDDGIRSLWSVLQQTGRTEDTLLVFTSDHGDTIGDYGTSDKRFFYECSAGVPLLLAGAGVPSDQREPIESCKALVSGVDLYPTFLDAAGVPDLLGNSPGDRCGKSLLRLVDGRAEPRQAVS